MTKEEYVILKDEYIDHIKEFITEHGQLFSHITVFGKLKTPKDEDEKKPAMIHIIIPPDFMKNDDSKDMFINKLLPEVSKELNKDFLIYGTVWSSEAWMRIAGADFDIDKDDFRDIPGKKEVVIISFESEDLDETFIYDIKRTGKQITSDGKLVDTIVLEEFMDDHKPTITAGRFTGLYKKLKK